MTLSLPRNLSHVLPLFKAIFTEPNPTDKAALQRAGIIQCSSVRLPLAPLPKKPAFNDALLKNGLIQT